MTGVSTVQARPVVAGVDGSAPALAAVRWAVLEAATLRAPLELVYVASDERGTAARRALREATETGSKTLRDNNITTDITITTAPAHGTPMRGLLDAALRAQLLVVATHGEGRPLEGFSDSVAARLAGHTACPLVAVPRYTERAGSGPVVVGVDSTPQSEPALAFAFATAAAHGEKVIAVRAWADGPSGSAHGEAYVVGYAEEQWLGDRLRPWVERYPGVWVRPEVVRGRAADALLEHGAGARMVVVGTRGAAAGLSGLLIGSTSQALLYRAEFPVAVVPAA